MLILSADLDPEDKIKTIKMLNKSKLTKALDKLKLTLPVRTILGDSDDNGENPYEKFELEVGKIFKSKYPSYNITEKSGIKYRDSNDVCPVEALQLLLYEYSALRAECAERLYAIMSSENITELPENVFSNSTEITKMIEEKLDPQELFKYIEKKLTHSKEHWYYVTPYVLYKDWDNTDSLEKIEKHKMGPLNYKYEDFDTADEQFRCCNEIF